MHILEKRASILREIRCFFDEQKFVEVETSVRIIAPAPEEHIDCPVVQGGGFLRASPELQMKKLLAAGMEKIYQIGPCFRDGEKGSRHNPEFTMLEWYRKNANYLDIKKDLINLLNRFDVFKNIKLTTLTVREAYQKYATWDPWDKWDQDRFDFDMASKIEKSIKEIGGGVFLTDYPLEAASLALSRGEIAERWEFYLDGMEIANCFTELCDKTEQMRRFEKAKLARKLLKEADYPIDCEFIDCLPQIGSAAGIALGVDRLVMLITGNKEISAVRA